MKFYQKIIFGSVSAFIILASSFFGWVYLNHATPILMYHQVVDSSPPRDEQVSPQLFERQMELLQKFGYHAISMGDYIDSLKKDIEISRKAVVITFDDGKEDVYTNAFPILRKYDYPAIIFLPTEQINTPGYLTWEQVKEMSEHNIAFGSHTQNHVYLPDLSEENQRDEIVKSKRILEERLGSPVDFFSYPAGGFSNVTKRVVKNAGYKAAVTTNRGFAPKNSDHYELKRVRLSNSDQDELNIWVKFAGYSKVFKKGENPY